MMHISQGDRIKIRTQCMEAAALAVSKSTEIYNSNLLLLAKSFEEYITHEDPIPEEFFPDWVKDSLLEFGIHEIYLDGFLYFLKSKNLALVDVNAK